ncbi:outer membrane protein assembly factor BamB family protein [Halorussus salinus]|uniref:outer membrane protein assembly factor BamB family protein n=1 Tax=Halorussus salinus TaxID=1364935 RepID=UPI00138F9C31|nr:PQQ-binding-like beta-propeller repeat protein [Halorussus salinus]
MSLSRRDLLTSTALLAGTTGAGCLSSDSNSSQQPVTNPTTADQSDLPPELRTTGISLDWYIPLGKRIPQPAIDNTGEWVFATSSTNGLATLDTTDGTQRWQKQHPQSGWLAPTTADGHVYATDYETLFVYDIETGEEMWRREWGDAGTIQASPTVEEGTVYLPNSSLPTSHTDSKFAEDLFAFGTGNGSLRWKRDIAKHDPVVASPLVYEDTLYVQTEQTGLFALDLSDGAEKWTFEPKATATRMGEGPQIAGGTLITSTRNFTYGLDPATGDVRWKTAGVYGDPVTDRSTVYARGDGGSLYALHAADGTEQWRLSRPGRLRTVSIADGSLCANFVRQTGEKDVNDSISTLYGIDGAGTEQWRFTRLCEGFSKASAMNGQLFVAGRYGDGRLHAFTPTTV